jgi:hypothetical protein
VGTPLAMLLGVTSVVLLIVCVNVANSCSRGVPGARASSRSALQSAPAAGSSWATCCSNRACSPCSGPRELARRPRDAPWQ